MSKVLPARQFQLHDDNELENVCPRYQKWMKRITKMPDKKTPKSRGKSEKRFCTLFNFFFINIQLQKNLRVIPKVTWTFSLLVFRKENATKSNAIDTDLPKMMSPVLMGKLKRSHFDQKAFSFEYVKRGETLVLDAKQAWNCGASGLSEAFTGIVVHLNR